MISEELWKRKFGSDLTLVGKVIILNGEARTAIGIVPANFRLKIWNFKRAGGSSTSLPRCESAHLSTSIVVTTSN